MSSKRIKIGVIGGVNATKIVIQKLFENDFNNVFVWNYKPSSKAKIVSGWDDLALVSKVSGYENHEFSRVQEIKKSIKTFKPEILFVVGLSQIVPKEIINIPKYGCIGFHPTKLPFGRGRAPLAWLILESCSLSSATFFLINERVDDGPILAQEDFDINEDDYAEDIEKKMLDAEGKALDSLLSNPQFPDLLSKEQEHKKAFYFEKRDPSDGIIDWQNDATEILRLIRATSKPFPFAYTYFENNKVCIKKAKISDYPIKGVIGKILRVNDSSFLVQCEDGVLEILSWDSLNKSWEPKVNMRLGFNIQEEIYHLRKKIEEITRKIDLDT